MARRETGEWTVEFTFDVLTAGYMWQLDKSGRETLAPMNWYFLQPIDVNQDWSATVRVGKGPARRAFDAFRQMATALEKLPAGASDDQGKELVKAFADNYGMLEARGKPMTYAEWVRAAGEFLELFSISRLIREGRTAEIMRNLHDDPRWEEIRYQSPRLQVYGIQGVWEGGYQKFQGLSTYGKAWKVFNTVIQRCLDGGLSLLPGGTRGEDAGVVNKTLLGMLYMRLWLDTKDAKDVPRLCAHCEGEVQEGNRGRKFCSDACRQKHYRRRVAADTT